MEDIFVRYADFPARQKCVLVVDENMDYNIYLNARQSRKQNMESLLHELKHIKGKDWLSLETAGIIEKMRHE